ncbi:hypothetical protein [Streptomyces lasiicapitis]|uniref:hypothetical protein n=1 Tax=Streptomyces lasiicapitis TaxID=1923961 RepID=UPI001669C197|nr:hypothetical protein [Streptomyces lasiicapitis]
MFTGIATYYSARTAEDQLKQSREETDESARSQASRVTFYGDVEEDLKSHQYYIVNRSADPVSKLNVMLEASVERKEEGTAEPQREHRYLVLGIWSIPPCSRIVLRSVNLAIDPAREGNGTVARSTVIIPGQYFKADRIYFTDSGGRRWKRSLFELVSWSKPFDHSPSTSGAIENTLPIFVKLVKSPRIQTAEAKPCGGS